MPTINLGRVGFVNHGDYSGSYTYKVNSVVKYNNSLYVSKSETIGNLPTNTGYWDVWVDANNLPYTPAGNISSTTVQGAINELDSEKAPLESPTFTGTVVLPSTTSIGTITNTELGYLDGVTSSIQTQLNAKIGATNYATSTVGGTVKARLNGTVAYFTIDGTDA